MALWQFRFWKAFMNPFIYFGRKYIAHEYFADLSPA